MIMQPVDGKGIASPSVRVNLANGFIAGPPVQIIDRKLKDLAGVFQDEAAFTRLPADRLAYSVQIWQPDPEGTAGGLIYGVTIIEPGHVGGEYFLTKGHFHAKRNAAEYYWCHAGRGLLLMMDEQRRCRIEELTPGSLHYIPGNTAHRTINIGDMPLSFGCCWPSDAGHDYETIARQGFSKRVFLENGNIRIVEVG